MKREMTIPVSRKVAALLMAAMTPYSPRTDDKGVLVKPFKPGRAYKHKIRAKRKKS